MNKADEMELNEWEKGNNLKVFRGYGKTKEELTAEWNEFESSMDTEQQLKSDDESIKVFGKTNLERYKDLLNTVDESTEHNYNYEFDDETLEKIDQAKQYMKDMNTVIIYPTVTVEELDDLYNQMKSQVPPEFMEANDTKTIELFGMNNEELYKSHRKELVDFYSWRDRVTSALGFKILSSGKALTDVNGIVRSYVEIAEHDIPLNEEYMIDEIGTKLASLIEYTPMSALNPVIGLNKPLPMYLPNENNVSRELIPENDIDLIDKFNRTFDDIYHGMQNDDFDDIRDQWFNYIAYKQKSYMECKINDSDATNQLAAGILENEILLAGWHPDYDIRSIENWEDINKQTLSQIQDHYYGDTKIVNLCELLTLIDKIEPDHTRHKRERRPNINPVYIVLSAGDKTTSQLIKWWTKGPFSHAALGMNYDLKNLMSFNNAGGEHQGLSIESLDMYVPDNRLVVYSIFINDEDYKALQAEIRYYLNNKDKTNYSKLNIVSLVLNKPLNFQYDMICSQFVDRLLKFINIDIANKDSSLISPNDFYRAASVNKRIYKLYDGKVKDYNSERIKKAVDRLLYSDNTKYFKELALLTEVGAKLLKHKKTNIKQNYKTQYGNVISNDGVGLASDDYHKVIQQHSIELTEPMMDEYDRLLAIKDDEEFIKEFNKWIQLEINNVYPLVNANNKKDLMWVKQILKKKDKDESGMSYALSMQAARLILQEDHDVSDDEIKAIFRENYFIKGDNPDKIRKELKLRQAYNKKILAMFNVMIKNNYDQLGIAKEEADRISDMFKAGGSDKYEAVKIIKDALDTNAKKFEVKPNVYDLRKLDIGSRGKAGVICISVNNPNETMSTLSRMIQKSLEWDCIIYSHGNTNPSIEGINQYRTELENIVKHNLEDEHKNQFLDYFGEETLNTIGDSFSSYREAAKKIKASLTTLFKFRFDENGYINGIDEDNSDTIKNLIELLISKQPKTVEQIETIFASNLDSARKLIVKQLYLMTLGTTIAPNDEFEEVMAELEKEFLIDTLIPMCQVIALDEYVCNHTDWVWTVQPTYTPEAGPFKTMNELVRELIKEGFKKILIFTCNPGGYEFPEDIKNSRVLIKYGDASTLMEGSIMKSFDDCLHTLDLAEDSLRQVCLENDIEYDNDEYLHECFTIFDNEIQALLEDKKKKFSWSDLGNVVKEIIAGLTWMFKQTINFFKNIVLKMKEMLKNLSGHKFIRPVNTRFIYVNKKDKTAKIVNSKVSSYAELERESVKSCMSISDAINDYQKENIKVYSNCAKVILQKSKMPRKINENAITEQDIANDILDCIPLMPVTETKEFPVQFTDDGDLLIKNYRKMDYNKEYQHSHNLLKTYDKSDSIEGIKYELARLWFVYTVIEADIYENNKITPEKRKEYNKIKAWIMNDFTKYSKVVMKLDPTFNFSEYYTTTPFSDVYIKIHGSTLRFLTNLIKSL